MNLSYKATQFIIKAIESKIQAYQERLNQEDLDEDEASDIINDSGFLEALCRDLKKNLNEGKTPDIQNFSDSSLEIKDRSSEELVKQVLQLSMNERLSLVDVITESIRQEFQSRQAQESSGEHPTYANVSRE
jgi:vacuolar-type H+-ATPase catalytic subunit A/Vma1